MAVVAVFCSKTGLHISTGLEMDQIEFVTMPIMARTVECWACGGSHSWSRRWASLIECDDPEARWAGAPMPQAKQLTPT